MADPKPKSDDSNDKIYWGANGIVCTNPADAIDNSAQVEDSVGGRNPSGGNCTQSSDNLRDSKDEKK